MAVMTGFRMYQKVRFPRTQPRLSKRTHTGTGEGRVPPGTVQVMLVAVRLGGGGDERVTCVWPFPVVHPPQVPQPCVLRFCTISPSHCYTLAWVMPSSFLPISTPSQGGTEHAQLPGYGCGLRKISAGVRVIHQDLEHGAHVEVTAVNGDPCAPCLRAHGRLQ